MASWVFFRIQTKSEGTHILAGGHTFWDGFPSRLLLDFRVVWDAYCRSRTSILSQCCYCLSVKSSVLSITKLTNGTYFTIVFPASFFEQSCPPSHHKPQGSYHIFVAPTVGADIEKTVGEGMHHHKGGRIRRIRGPPALASGWNPSRGCSKCQVGIDGLDLGEVWDLDVDLNGDSMILVDCGISMGQWGYITTITIMGI